MKRDRRIINAICDGVLSVNDVLRVGEMPEVDREWLLDLLDRQHQTTEQLAAYARRGWESA